MASSLLTEELSSIMSTPTDIKSDKNEPVASQTTPKQVQESPTQQVSPGAQDQTNSSNPPEAQESRQDKNWRQFRQEREKERKAKEEADRKAAQHAAEAAALKAALEAVVTKSATSPSQSEEAEETEDDRIQKKIHHYLEAERQKNETAQIEKEKRELVPTLKRTFNDFDQVITPENLDYLEYHYPEAIEGYKNQPDSVQKWTNLYKLAKRFIPNPDSRKEEKRIEKNLLKPQSMSSPGMTQIGDEAPRMLDDKIKEANWRRMQKAMKGV
jgi:hypothetical protein